VPRTLLPSSAQATASNAAPNVRDRLGLNSPRLMTSPVHRGRVRLLPLAVRRHRLASSKGWRETFANLPPSWAARRSWGKASEQNRVDRASDSSQHVHPLFRRQNDPESAREARAGEGGSLGIGALRALREDLQWRKRQGFSPGTLGRGPLNSALGVSAPGAVSLSLLTGQAARRRSLLLHIRSPWSWSCAPNGSLDSGQFPHLGDFTGDQF
jgi:hypothetical protein